MTEAQSLYIVLVYHAEPRWILRFACITLEDTILEWIQMGPQSWLENQIDQMLSHQRPTLISPHKVAPLRHSQNLMSPALMHGFYHHHLTHLHVFCALLFSLY